MRLPSIAICLVITVLVTLRLATATDLAGARPPVLDENGCIDGNIPMTIELSPRDQIRWFGARITSAEVKEILEKIGNELGKARPRDPAPAVLIVANDKIPESRVSELLKLCTDNHVTRILRVKAYPDGTSVANAALASPTAQAEKFHILKSDAGLTFSAAAQVVQFYESEDHSLWWAKILIPKESYAKFKEAILKERDGETEGSAAEIWRPRWWTPVDPEFRRVTLEDNDIDCIVTVAVKEDDHHYAIYVGCEVR